VKIPAASQKLGFRWVLDDTSSVRRCFVPNSPETELPSRGGRRRCGILFPPSARARALRTRLGSKISGALATNQVPIFRWVLHDTGIAKRCFALENSPETAPLPPRRPAPLSALNPYSTTHVGAQNLIDLQVFTGPERSV
jgi:hypothetical protein